LGDEVAQRRIFGAGDADDVRTMSDGNVARPVGLARLRHCEATLGKRIPLTDIAE
jgi:hypothetical protein